MLEGCKNGDSRYQEALYRTFASKMMGVCMRYCDRTTAAEDLLQEGFIKVFRNIDTFRSEGSLEGWIRRIMVTTALEHFRREVRFFPLNEAKQDSLSSGHDGIISRMSSEEVVEAIRALPAGYRTILNLYVVEGYSHAEIAQMLQISEGTSKSQLSRARDLLKKNIEALNQERIQHA